MTLVEGSLYIPENVSERGTSGVLEAPTNVPEPGVEQIISFKPKPGDFSVDFLDPNKFNLFMDDELQRQNSESSWTQERLKPKITPLGLKGYFNPAVIPRSDGTITLLARQVGKPAEHGRPDMGPLVEITLKHDGSEYQVLEKQQIWKPEDSPQALIEDVRALNDPKGENKQVFLGATVVVDRTVVDEFGQKKVEPAAYGAIAILDDETQISDAPQRFRICPELGIGKNMTPIDMNGNFLFREEGVDGDHNFILSVIHYDEATDTVTKTGELDFREQMKGVPWGNWRIGTTAAMLTDEKIQTLVIHGIRTEKVPQSPDGNMYYYSIGIACLEKQEDGTLRIVGVDPQPMVTPDDFSDESKKRLGEQLHPNLRDATYLCGIVKQTDGNGNESIDQFISYGDTETMLASISVNDIKERTQQIYASQRLQSESLPKVA